MNENKQCQGQNQEIIVQMADRLWRKRMRKEIGFKLL